MSDTSRKDRPKTILDLFDPTIIPGACDGKDAACQCRSAFRVSDENLIQAPSFPNHLSLTGIERSINNWAVHRAVGIPGGEGTTIRLPDRRLAQWTINPSDPFPKILFTTLRVIMPVASWIEYGDEAGTEADSEADSEADKYARLLSSKINWANVLNEIKCQTGTIDDPLTADHVTSGFALSTVPDWLLQRAITPTPSTVRYTIGKAFPESPAAKALAGSVLPKRGILVESILIGQLDLDAMHTREVLHSIVCTDEGTPDAIFEMARRTCEDHSEWFAKTKTWNGFDVFRRPPDLRKMNSGLRDDELNADLDKYEAHEMTLEILFDNAYRRKADHVKRTLGPYERAEEKRRVQRTLQRHSTRYKTRANESRP